MIERNVRLTHVCRAKEYAGEPGDVVRVPEALAAEWAAANGCVLLDEAPAQPAAAKEAEPTAKTKPTK